MKTADFLVEASIAIQGMKCMLNEEQYQYLELIATAMADQIDSKFQNAEKGIKEARKLIYDKKLNVAMRKK